MQKLKDYLQEHDSITLDDYMENCLHHPDYGYYRVGNPLGRTGDFITSPEISQIFGELIGVFIDFHVTTLFNADYQICELGAGRGVLATDYLRSIKQKPTNIFFLESNHHFKKEQLIRIPTAQHIEKITDLPPCPTLFLANEFFDSLPIKAFKLFGAEQAEIIIKKNQNNQLYFDYANPTKNTHNNHKGIYEISPQTTEFCKQIAEHITNNQGAFLCCDYGYDMPINTMTFRGFKNHTVTDGLQTPYHEDLTADVNFPDIISLFKQNNLIVHDLITQAHFLKGLFIDKRLHQLLRSVDDNTKRQDLITGVQKLLSPIEMGERFKFLFVTGLQGEFYPFTNKFMSLSA